MNRKFFMALMGTVFLAGCYYDVEEELYGTCNTANITYSSSIMGILNRYGCITCHSGPTPGGNFTLDDHDAVKARADDGRLFGAISHMQGYEPMPQGAPKMTQCEIDRVKAWIDAGAPDN